MRRKTGYILEGRKKDAPPSPPREASSENNTDFRVKTQDNDSDDDSPTEDEGHGPMAHPEIGSLPPKKSATDSK